MSDIEPALASKARVDRWVIIALVGVILGGVALRIWVGWWLGHLGDLTFFQRCSLRRVEIPLMSGYERMSINYPPLYISVIRLMRWAHEALHLPGDYTLPIQLAQDVSVQRPLILFLKLPIILADAVCAVIIFRLATLVRTAAAGLVIVCIYLFNPAILYDGAYYGQTDTILFAFSLGAVLALIERRGFLLGLVGVASFMLKAQAFVTLMVIGIVLAGQWREVWRRQAWRLILGGLTALAGTVVLAAVTGSLPQFVNGYFGLTRWHPLTSINALNVWWLATRPWERTPYMSNFPLDTLEVLPGVSARLLGIVLFFTALSVIAWRLHRARYSPYAVVLAAACAGWAFFSLLTQMHERYSVPALGFMCVLCLWDKRWYVWTAVASVAVTLNIVLSAYFIFPPARWLQHLVNWILWPDREREWTILAVLLVLMLPVCLEALWRLGRAGRRAAAELRTGFPVLSGHEAKHTVSRPNEPR